ncbi:hypothetical protein [Shewanella litoralis]|uniref:DUF4946 domain-containing protein n=1 Tax=Shewanella litoralis TaxID=2282700 RepID=A0ABQ2RDU0_9GAMM|nr:hypothetical protein [Shewanella litoralis]GGQ26886.1 hypothetical protein GCM10009411_28390 [Shewanella litoralis]
MNKIAAVISYAGCVGIFSLFPYTAYATFPALVTLESDNDASGVLVMSSDVQRLTTVSQTFGFLPPLSWKLAFNEKRGDMTMAEFIPANETLNDWSSLVCMQGFKGLAEDVEPEEFLDSMADTYKEHCQGEVIYQQLGSMKVEGYEAVHGLLGCTSMPNIHNASAIVSESYVTSPRGEMGYFTVISDDEDIFLVHKSIRTAVFAAESAPVTQNNYREFMAEP